MSDQPIQPGPAAPDQYPSPEQYRQAAAAAGAQVPYGQAAAAASDEVVDPTSGGTDAGETIEQIRQQIQRDVLLPMETQIQAMMDAAKEQQAALVAQIQAQQAQMATLQARLTATQAQVGPPAATLYAASVAQRVRSIAAANPDLGGAHFAQVIAAADAIADKGKDVAKGAAEPAELEKLAAPVEKFFARSRVEGAGTVVAELAHMAEELAKLAVAA